jgi:hypothetical protein
VPNGYIALRFYANDTLGHINFNEVVILKDAPVSSPSQTIPGYEILILAGIISLIVIVRIKFKPFKEIY